MSEFKINTADLRLFFKRQSLFILFITLSIVTLCFFLAKLRPTQYETEAELKIDYENNLVFGLENISSYRKRDNLAFRAHEITSYAMLLRLAKKNDLIADTLTENDLIDNQRLISQLDKLKSTITVSYDPITKSILIRVRASDPQTARELANSLAYEYRQFSFHKEKVNLQKNKLFLRKQLRSADKELAKIEQKLERFKQGQQIPYIDRVFADLLQNITNIDNQIEDLDYTLAIIKLQRSRLINRYYEKTSGQSLADTTQKMDLPNEMEWLSEIGEKDEKLRQMSKRFTELQIELHNNSSFYTTNHPVIKELKKKIQKTIKDILQILNNKMGTLEKRKERLIGQKKNSENQLNQYTHDKLIYSQLLRSLRRAERVQATLNQKIQELLIAEAGLTEDIIISHYAEFPKQKVHNNTMQIAVVGLYFGLLIGIISGIVREMIDSSIKTLEDFQYYFHLPLLSVIPYFFQSQKKFRLILRKPKKRLLISDFRSLLVTHFDSQNHIADTYRILKENINSRLSKDSLQVILMTSAQRHEGKSITIANVAISFAQQGKKVVIVECDFRAPTMEKIFGLSHHRGVTDIIIEKYSWQECLITVTDLILDSFTVDDLMKTPGIDNVHILPHGLTNLNPDFIVNSNGLEKLFQELRHSYDLILIDAPSFLTIADSMILCRYADGVVLVYKIANTSRQLLKLCIQRIESTKIPIIGTVINMTDDTSFNF